MSSQGPFLCALPSTENEGPLHLPGFRESSLSLGCISASPGLSPTHGSRDVGSRSGEPASLLLYVLRFYVSGNEVVLMRVSAQRIGNWPTSLSPVGPSLVILPQMGSLGYEDDQPGGGFELGTVVHSCNLSTKEDDAGGHL